VLVVLVVLLVQQFQTVPTVLLVQQRLSGCSVVAAVAVLRTLAGQEHQERVVSV
jgi:hypothetical protein